jgi:hypothetical protein
MPLSLTSPIVRLAYPLVTVPAHVWGVGRSKVWVVKLEGPSGATGDEDETCEDILVEGTNPTWEIRRLGPGYISNRERLNDQCYVIFWSSCTTDGTPTDGTHHFRPDSARTYCTGLNTFQLTWLYITRWGIRGEERPGTWMIAY